MNSAGQFQLPANSVLLEQLTSLVRNLPVNIDSVTVGVANQGVEFRERYIVVQERAEEGVRRKDLIKILNLAEPLEEVAAPVLILEVSDRSFFGFIVPSFGEW